jgi:molybdenum cofactor biosynthesis protein MoaC
MVDITHKIKTLRTATAKAVVKLGDQATKKALLENKVPKGDVFEMAKTAGLFAVKNTSQNIPDCHPLPVEFTAVDYEIEGLEVTINVTVKTVYKTGVEVEAMHGASIAALTMYDMLKPLDKNIEIRNISLVKKSGGKSSFQQNSRRKLKACVVVCSDSISEGKKEDRAGKAIIEKLEKSGVEIASYEVIPDEAEIIRNKALTYSGENDLVIYTGGTGLSFRDVTPEALEPIIERRIPGIEEAIRNYGQERMPYAMLSRSLAGTIGNCLVLALPGSTSGARESMEAVFPHLLHVFKILRGAKHPENV